MFSNLIESASHQQDLARKGRFFLATLLGYALVVGSAGLASIYAYDAHVENQDLEFLGLVPPIIPEQPAPQARTAEQRNSNRQRNPIIERTQAIDRISDSSKIPDKVSGERSNAVELPKHGPYVIGDSNTNPEFSGPISNTPPGDGISGTGTLVKVETPPPANDNVVKTPRPEILRSGLVLNGKALSLPKPIYPALAKIAKAAGPVNVQILIDETGKVISARASSGHPMLRSAAERAAFQAKFSPTLLTDKPVKVSGVITYNFSLQ